MPHRPRNPSGFVRKHPDTASLRWQGVVKYWDVTEERWRQRSATFGLAAEAEAWVDVAKMEHRKTPGYRPPTHERLRDYLPRWLESVVPQVRATTVRSYRQMLAHSITASGDVPLDALTPLDCQRVVTHVLAAGRSPRTARYAFVVLRHALKDAVDWGLISVNPADRAKPPRTPRTELVVPTATEAQALVSAAEEDRFYALWALLAVTGLRLGEALGLQWSDLDLARQRLVVRRTLSGGGGRKRLEPPKTDRGARTVALDSWLIGVLADHRARQREDQAAADTEWASTDFVFTTRRGTWLDHSNIHRAYKAALARAGLPTRFRVHDLRHAMATAWLAGGVNPKIVSERLGHASVAFTLQVYGHVLPDAQGDAAEQMAHSWGGVTMPSPRADRNPDDPDKVGDTLEAKGLI